MDDSLQTLISFQLNNGRLQTVNLLATANNRSRSRQIRKLIDKVSRKEINSSIETIVDKAYERWKLFASSSESWEQFKRTVNNWLHGKQIGQKNIEKVLSKLQEKYEADHNN